MTHPRIHHITVSLALLAAPAAAQAQVPRPALAPGVRDAGTLHVATGTWTRSSISQLSLGSAVVFNNDAAAGYYMPIADGLAVFDEGRLPGPGDPGLSGAICPDYRIDGFQIGYCVSDLSGAFSNSIRFYGDLGPCDIASLPTATASIDLSSLPGAPAPGTTACWTVTIDLTGTPDEFVVAANADGTYDADPDLDSFGWRFAMTGIASGPAGPMISGDPAGAPEGDGTYYQNPSAALGTGLGVQDSFGIIDAGGGLATGCYDFGGYAPGVPFSSFFLKLYGACDDGAIGTSYCVSTANSTGLASTITAFGSASISANDLVLEARNVPSIPGVGIFIASPTQNQVPLYNGYLCASPPGLQRIMQITPPVNGTVTQAIDYTGVLTATQPLNVMIGQPHNFQFWYRDPQAGGAFANFSDAVSLDMTP
jgi:hypothetical protein